MGARGDCDAKVPKALSANELSGTVTGPVVQARTIQGDVRIQVDAGPQAPPPAQLAPAPALFIDRRRELSELDELLGTERTTAHAPALIVISGLGGVGKSALALHWLHRIRDRFPDGQLYADLRGSDQGQPVSVSEVLERFLRALGIAPERVPAELDEQVALFRSATAGRRLAVLLDNALSAAQVRSLLPASPYGLVCVTTRHRLSGLIVDGARFVELAPLAEDAATELLTRVVGEERVSAEPEAARELAGLCGMLPIALCASAARLASHRRRSIARLVRELRDARRRLSMLSLDEEISVQAALDVSYNGLPEDQARLYRLVGLHPGDDFTAEVAGAAAGVDPGEAADLLDALAGAYLIEEEGEDRYRFHDLLRLHARAKAMEVESPEARLAAETRVARWFLRAAAAADLVVIPGRWHLGPVYAELRSLSPAFDSPAAALDWLEEELPNLRAVLRLAYERGLYDVAWELCEALWGLFYSRKHYADWLETHRIGIAAARELGDARAESRLSMALAYAYRDLRRYGEAADLYRRALALERANDHAVGEAAALSGLGSTCLGLNRPDEAIEYFEQARAIHERLGRPRGVTRMLRRLAEAYRDAGRLDEAADAFARAGEIFADLDEPLEQARALTGLGRTLLQAGRAGSAIEPLRRARAMAEELGARHAAAEAGMYLADALVAAGDPAGAREHLTRALEIFVDLMAPQADLVRERLASLNPQE